MTAPDENEQANTEKRLIRSALRNYPYLIHTNRELGLMLRGEKPLAIFAEMEGAWPDVLQRYLRRFDRYAEKGTLVRIDHFELVPGGCVHHVHFTLPGEEWRSAAKLELFRKFQTEGRSWSASDEREFGRLLGYKDWQNDFWIARHYSG